MMDLCLRTVAGLQERVAEQSVDILVLVQLAPQEYVQERIAEQGVQILVHLIKEEIGSGLQERTAEQSESSLVPPTKEDTKATTSKDASLRDPSANATQLVSDSTELFTDITRKRQHRSGVLVTSRADAENNHV